MGGKLKTLLLVVFVICVPGIALLVGWLWSDPGRSISASPFPDPNGYDDLVAAGSMLNMGNEDAQRMGLEELRALVLTNAAGLQRARLGLSRECQVRLDDPSTSSVHLEGLAKLKGVAQAFAAEARQTELEGRSSEALKPCLDIFKLSEATVRGGVVIDQLVATAIEAIGAARLRALTSKLDAEHCREAGQTLEEFDARKTPFPEILKQENQWARKTFGARYWLFHLIGMGADKAALKKAGDRVNHQMTVTRQLSVDLAARAYELDKGHRPSAVSDLVPDYLKAVPQDPDTHADLTLSP